MGTKVAVIEGPLNRAEKTMLKQYEAEADSAIKDGNQAAARLGQALWDIQTEQLYRGAFIETVTARFGISKSAAYRCIEIAKAVLAHPELPVPSQYAIEQARPPKRPKVGTSAAPLPAETLEDDDAEPSIIDVEGEDIDPSTEPATAIVSTVPPLQHAHDDPSGGVTHEHVNEPGHSHPAPTAVVSGPHQAPTPNSPGARLDSQPEVPAGLTAPGGEDTPLEAAIIDDEAWNSANVVKPSEMAQAEYDAWTTKLHDDAKARLDAEHPGLIVTEDGQVSGYLAVTPTPPGDPIAASISALVLLCENADMRTMGGRITQEQITTVRAALNELDGGWADAHPARAKGPGGAKATVTPIRKDDAPVPMPKAERPAVAPRQANPLNRREVTPMPKAGKAK